MTGEYEELMQQLFSVKNNCVSAEEFLYLRKLLGWCIYDLEELRVGLRGSVFNVGIYRFDTIVGMGRIVGDSRICFYLQDIMVDPSFQNQGIGTVIVASLLAYIQTNAVNSAYVGLMSKLGKSGFYERFGFVSRPNDQMGPGMVIPCFDSDTVGNQTASNNFCGKCRAIADPTRHRIIDS